MSDRSDREQDLSQQRNAPARTERADELERVRTERAEKLAVEHALQAERVRVRLDDHDRRLNAINGSIGRTAKSLDRLTQSIDAIRSEMQTREAISAALNNTVREANEKQITTRQFWLGVVAIVAPIIVLIVTQARL